MSVLNQPSPNHALQRTGSAVTAPAADHHRLSTHRQVPRPLRLSLSLGSLGDSAHLQWMNAKATNVIRSMKLLLTLFLAIVVTMPLAGAITIGELLPWLAPNPLAFGTPISEFEKSHPTAKELFPTERRPGIPFSGGLSARTTDGALFLYGFAGDELASVNWASNPRGNIRESLLSVRKALIQTHGQPTVETMARIDSRGSIARIVREVYRPTHEKDFVICLLATSEGVEVALTNEAIQRKHGIATSRESYEEAVRAMSAVVQVSEKPSELIDYLAAARAVATQP